jgi:hypothetical protein
VIHAGRFVDVEVVGSGDQIVGQNDETYGAPFLNRIWQLPQLLGFAMLLGVTPTYV